MMVAYVSEPPDVETLAEVLAPDHVNRSSWGVDSREYHGLEGFLAARAEMSTIWGSWEQELERVLDAGDKGVVALLRFRGKGRQSEAPIEFEWAVVYTLRDGRLVTTTAFNSQAEALRVAGLQA